jgi:pantoate--beta-alanine ligase
MTIIDNIKTIEELLFTFKKDSKTIGFVPTMGALHEGHISLVKKAIEENDICVCSIFVNPTQFNNATDLEKYPKTLEADIDKLQKAGCQILFTPTAVEMYPTGEAKTSYSLGYLETLLEGKYRAGHFQGVCMIVDKLLSIVMPTVLYLGRKDYQQCMVIKKMMADKPYAINLSICDTVREADGLAMSSRNMRLNEIERQKALCIIKSLEIIQHGLKAGSLKNLKREATFFLEKNGYKVDYTEIADAETLELQNEWDGKKKLVALVAAYLNEVRLIDNIIL